MLPYEIKLHAKKQINQQRRSVIFTSCAYLVVYMILSILTVKLFGYDKYINDLLLIVESGDPSAVLPAFPAPEITALVLVALVGLMAILVGTGYTGTFLKTARGEKFGIRALMDGFEFLFRALAIHVIRGVLVWFGFAFCVVPGIILLYRYRFAIFVMYDNPDKGAVWCLRESARLMRGRKLELFRLDFSFLGFYLLTQVVAMVGAPLMDIIFNPYFGVSTAAFYDSLLPKKPEDDENSDL